MRRKKRGSNTLGCFVRQENCAVCYAGSFLARTAMGTTNALVSLCVRDMQGQRAVLATNAVVQGLPNLSTALAADIINRYALHTGVVMINLSDLQTFEYVRPIDETNVQKLVRSMLVSRG